MFRFVCLFAERTTCFGCTTKQLVARDFHHQLKIKSRADFGFGRFPRNELFRKARSRLQHNSAKTAVEKPASRNEITRLFKLTKPVRLRITGGIVLLIISSGISISVPFFMGKIIDTMLSSSPEDQKSAQNTTDAVKNGNDQATANSAVSEQSKSNTSNTSSEDEKSSFFSLRTVPPNIAPHIPIGQNLGSFSGENAVAFDKQKAEKVMKQLGQLCGILIGVFTVGAVANFGRAFLMATAAQRVINKLRTNVFLSIIKQEMAFFDKSKTGELVNRLSNDATLVGHSITMNISDGLRALAQAAGGSAMMIYVSPSLALVGFCIIPPVAIAGVMYGRYAKNLMKQMNDALAAATQVAEERISNIRIVRAFGAEAKENKEYSARIDVVLNWAKQDAFARSVFFGFAGLSGNLIMLAILYAGGSFVTGGIMTIGQLSSFLLYALYVGVSIGGLSQFYTELMRGVGASTRLFELVDKRELIPLVGGIKPSTLRGELKFENINFAYPVREDAAIFKNLNLTVPEGKVTALVGHSGSGKSTLAALLLRFYDPTEGRVLLDGMDVKSLDPTWLRKNIGTVTQDPTLFSCSVAENIAYGAENIEAVTFGQVKQAATQANALEFIEKFPNGFSTLVGERGLTLSGGQRQRVAIARALLNNPKLLILDEATSALDAESEHQVRMALERLIQNGQRTILIIAHRLSTVKNADQIAVISEGTVKELGDYRELMAIENGIFKQLVEKQSIGPEDSYIE